MFDVIHHMIHSVSVDTSITGGLPFSFEKLTNLIELRLGSNMFSGELASFSDLGNLLLLDLSGKDQFHRRQSSVTYLMNSFYCSHVSVIVFR